MVNICVLTYYTQYKDMKGNKCNGRRDGSAEHKSGRLSCILQSNKLICLASGSAA